jgi:hypothetical protein
MRAVEYTSLFLASLNLFYGHNHKTRRPTSRYSELKDSLCVMFAKCLFHTAFYSKGIYPVSLTCCFTYKLDITLLYGVHVAPQFTCVRACAVRFNVTNRAGRYTHRHKYSHVHVRIILFKLLLVLWRGSSVY